MNTPTLSIPVTPNFTHPNLLVMSNSADFRRQAIIQAIQQTLHENKKVMIVSAAQSATALCHDYAVGSTAYAIDEIEAFTTPYNSPYFALNKAKVVCATPLYLQRQLTLPVPVPRSNSLRHLGLIVVDGLDACLDPHVQGILELTIQRLGLQPVDGQPRRVVVAVDPIAYATQLAQWLGAELHTDGLIPEEGAPFTSAWHHTPQTLVLMLLAAEVSLSPDSLCQLVQASFNGADARLEDAIRDLFRLRAITANPLCGEAAYLLTRNGLMMARHRMSVADVDHLCSVIQHDCLTWFDLLLVAATCPSFPVSSTLTTPEIPGLAEALAGLHSTLLQQPVDKIVEQLRVTPSNLGQALKAALVGYAVTRGWSTQAISDHLHLTAHEVEVITLALRRGIAAMLSMTTRPASAPTTPSVQRIQTLYHMLTGVAPCYLGLMALPTIQHWVIDILLQANITSLVGLLLVDPHTIPLNPGLLSFLRFQANVLLLRYPDEATFLASFTDPFPLIGDVSATLNSLIA